MRNKIITALLAMGLLIPTTVCAEPMYSKVNLNFRADPNLQSEIYEVLKPNDEVETVGYPYEGWQEIDYDNKRGFVYAEYLTKYQTNNMYVTASRLNLREQPNTECKILNTVNKNTKLKIIKDSLVDNWYKGITKDEIEFYVYADYVTDEEPVENVSNDNSVNQDDLYWLSRILMLEMGCDWIPDSVQQMVASVVINRVNSPIYPNTIKDVIFQGGQYANQGMIASTVPTQKVINNARYVLENGSTIPSNVLGQAGFPQGKGTYTTYYDSVLGTTTYFSYF